MIIAVMSMIMVTNVNDAAVTVVGGVREVAQPYYNYNLMRFNEVVLSSSSPNLRPFSS